VKILVDTEAATPKIHEALRKVLDDLRIRFAFTGAADGEPLNLQQIETALGLMAAKVGIVLLCECHAELMLHLGDGPPRHLVSVPMPEDKP
jgi:hypothetical protein